MIDVNAMLNTAISTAITTQLGETLKSIDAVLAAQAARIAQLEAKSDTDTARIVSLLDTASPEFVEAVEAIAERVSRDAVEERTSNYGPSHHGRASKSWLGAEGN